MEGTGVPIATPFDEDGRVDEASLADLVDELVDRGVDFLVPCGSTSEAPLLSDDERARVIEVVADAASVPVVAGTGRPGLRPTLAATERAAAAGADAALVVTPSYYGHDEAALAAHYRDLADESPLPVVLYSVPKFTGVALSPETVASLSTHDDVAGIKDSAGELGRLQRTVDRTSERDFSVLVGSGALYADGLAAGADGGVLAVANAAPAVASRIYDAHQEGDDDRARALNRRLLELDHAVTTAHGVPGVKAAMGAQGLPAGRPRRPLRPVADDVRTAIGELVAELGDVTDS